MLAAALPKHEKALYFIEIGLYLSLSLSLSLFLLPSSVPMPRPVYRWWLSYVPSQARVLHHMLLPRKSHGSIDGGKGTLFSYVAWLCGVVV
jgi:hypothetical protein